MYRSPNKWESSPQQKKEEQGQKEPEQKPKQTFPLYWGWCLWSGVREWADSVSCPGWLQMASRLMILSQQNHKRGIASPMVGQGQLLRRAMVPEVPGTCLLCTVQQLGASAVWGHRSWDECKEKSFLVTKTIAHHHFDSCASNLFPLSTVSCLCCSSTEIWLIGPVI